MCFGRRVSSVARESYRNDLARFIAQAAHHIGSRSKIPRHRQSGARPRKIGAAEINHMARENPARRIDLVNLAIETRLGSQLLALNDDEVVQLLRVAVKCEGNQTAFARRHGLERTSLNMILQGKRPVVKALGLRKVYALD